MKKRNLIYTLVTLILPFSILFFSSNSGGVIGKSVTGCVPCHGSTLNTNTNITLSGIAPGGYIAGQTYNVILNVSNSTYTMSGARAGFNLSVNGGALVAGAGQVIAGPLELRHHVSPAVMTSGLAAWSFTWTAPATGFGAINFNIAGNATNGNSGTSGDAHNQTTITFNEAPSTMVPSVNLGTPVENVTAATIKGFINANGANTTDTVEYGLTTAYGSKMSMMPNPVTGNTNTSVTANLSGLTAGTIYHYRIKATNSVGTTLSADATFKTLWPVATSDLKKDIDFSIYPNPASDILTIGSSEDIASLDLVLYNYSGQQQQVQLSKLSNKKWQLDVSALARGAYFLVGKTAESSFNKKIILQ